MSLKTLHHRCDGNPANAPVDMDVSENGGFSPQINHFKRVFHYIHHPFWGPTPIFGNTHMVNIPLFTRFYTFQEAQHFSSINCMS